VESPTLSEKNVRKTVRTIMKGKGLPGRLNEEMSHRKEKHRKKVWVLKKVLHVTSTDRRGRSSRRKNRGYPRGIRK